MKITKAYKTELDPNNKQKTLFGRCVGAARFVYNWGLAEWKRQYEDGEKPSCYGLRKQFNAQKDEICPWIRDLPYAVVESSFANLGAAFDNFFGRVKQGKAEKGYPRFKKRGKDGAFQVRNIKVENDRVRITGAGWVRLKESDYIPIEAEKYGVYATISERAGRWYISILVEIETGDLELPTCAPMGIDLGIKSLAVCSDGKVFENPKMLTLVERKLKRLQREVSRREKGSSNRRKSVEKLARCHARVSDIRRHALHEVSHYVTFQKRPSVVVLEDLNVRGMLTNHHLAKAISDASFSELRRQIEYKAGWSGIDVVIADRFYPSSKTCSNCGSVKNDLSLDDRIYKCENCGFEIDRDLNAAINLSHLVVPNGETHRDCLGS